WLEGGVAPQVVFEIRSPSNTDQEMDEKFAFFDQYGVEEYYLYDPPGLDLRGWRRDGGRLQPIRVMHRWGSRRLGIAFDLSGQDLVIFHPSGEPFWPPQEIKHRQVQAEQRAEQERRQKEQAEQRAEQERREREQADQRAEQERRQKAQAEQ